MVRRMRAAVAVVGLLGLVGLALVGSGVGAGAQGTDVPYVAQHAAVSAYSHDPGGVAVDRWAVWVCEIAPGLDLGTDERVALDPADAAEALTATITPYFEWLSDGAYRPTFTPMGTIDPGPQPSPGAAEDACKDDAIAGSAGFQGALAVKTSADRGAEATSGHELCGGAVPCTADVLPDSRRAGVIGAANLVETTTFGPPDLASTAHEIGHALDWQHADAGFLTPDNEPEWERILASVPGGDSIDLDPLRELLADPDATPEEIRLLFGLTNFVLEYGDITDIMGATPSPRAGAAPTEVIQTQVFNRHAAGWLDPDEVVVHEGGVQEVALAPLGVDGVQMVVLPTGDRLEYVTLEARQATPFFPSEDAPGVIAHRIDMRPEVCGRATECWGEEWRTEAIGGYPWELGQVAPVGDVRTILGVRVEVLAVDADGVFTVRLGEAAPTTTTTTAPPPVAVVATPAFTG